MAKNIEQYLSQLRKELAGCDRATIQDALSSTEEHLSMALDSLMEDGTVSETDALAEVIEEYGQPGEVAKAYRETEHLVTPVLAPRETKEEIVPAEPEDDRPLWKRFFGIFADTRAWGALLFLLFSLVTGTVYFTWVVTGLGLSAGLMVLIVGLPIAALFILSVRGIGLVEGLMVEALLGIRMPKRQIFYRTKPGWWDRFKQIISDKQTWFSIVYLILKLPLGIFNFSVLIVCISVSLYLIGLPILQLGFSLPFIYMNGVSYFIVGWMLPVSVILGVLALTLTMHLSRYLGRAQGLMAKAMLVKFYD